MVGRPAVDRPCVPLKIIRQRTVLIGQAREARWNNRQIGEVSVRVDVITRWPDMRKSPAPATPSTAPGARSIAQAGVVLSSYIPTAFPFCMIKVKGWEVRQVVQVGGSRQPSAGNVTLLQGSRPQGFPGAEPLGYIERAKYRLRRLSSFGRCMRKAQRR